MHHEVHEIYEDLIFFDLRMGISGTIDRWLVSHSCFQCDILQDPESRICTRWILGAGLFGL
jgi:hypothetical protein